MRGGHAKDSRQSEADAVFPLQHSLFGLNLACAIEGNQLERRFLGARNARLANAIATISHRH